MRAKKVGEHWNFKRVFSGGEGVIYAISDTGDLFWYRHDGRNDGSSGGATPTWKESQRAGTSARCSQAATASSTP